MRFTRNNGGFGSERQSTVVPARLDPGSDGGGAGPVARERRGWGSVEQDEVASAWPPLRQGPPAHRRAGTEDHLRGVGLARTALREALVWCLASDSV